jgi:hypothetical protein
MPDQVILDHKNSYLVSSKNFHFFNFYQKLGYQTSYQKFGIISTKTSKSLGKSRGGLRSGNKVSQNTFKNAPEYHRIRFVI